MNKGWDLMGGCRDEDSKSDGKQYGGNLRRATDLGIEFMQAAGRAVLDNAGLLVTAGLLGTGVTYLATTDMGTEVFNPFTFLQNRN